MTIAMLFLEFDNSIYVLLSCNFDLYLVDNIFVHAKIGEGGGGGGGGGSSHV